ncbi:MAG TPA: peptide ABC transporter substrate-binding protein [Candidatus Paceibacterota bacterium]
MISFFKLFTRHLRLPLDRSPNGISFKKIMIFSRQLPSNKKRLLIYIISIGCLFLLSGITLASNHFLVTVPVKGGVISEGIVGTPRFINPLLATSDADKDLVAIIYSGLLRPGKLEKFELDLAESYSISEDGTIYTFHLKKNLFWHDGSPFSAKDVVFTTQMAQDDRIKSPKRASWDGVIVEALDENTVKMTIRTPYAPFIENTIMGILPEHLWRDIRPEEFALHVLNLKPVGTGPYKIKSIKNGSSGVPSSIELEAFKDFALGTPNIDKISLIFSATEDDVLKLRKYNDLLAISGISTETYNNLSASSTRIEKFKLPRIFGIFFNQNYSAILADKSIRKALELATPRSKLVELAMGGLAEIITSPLPVLSIDRPMENNPSVAEEVLDKAGWRKGADGIRSKKQKRLHLEIATSDSPELKKVADILSMSWQNIGVETVVKIYEPSDLNVNVIRPRKFDALLFGEGLGHFPDPYAFWHSSGRLDPGLNIAQYTNSRADRAMEDIRASTEQKKRKDAYNIFLTEVQNDIPAIFLYSPQFVYLPNPNIKGLAIQFLTGPSDRFNQVHKWYIKTEKIWPIFKTHNQ